MDPEKPVRLTQTVSKGGCAAKLPATDLRTVLAGIHLESPKELLIGMGDMDDAALWDQGDGSCLIHTTDFFTPIVDDPFDFGAVAAANALSDVYAMGGVPQTALCILGFPASDLPLDLIKPLLLGAQRVISKSGACLAGGHTIENPALVFGLAVTGKVRKDHYWSNKGAQAGDALILTKGLGTGTLTSGLKNGEVPLEWVDAAVESMTKLNDAAPLLKEHTVHAATDVTGFSLAGHAMQMALASEKSFEMETEKLPSITGALQALEKGILNKAHRTNQKYVAGKVIYKKEGDARYWLTLDPQTSGGLLLCIPQEEANHALSCLKPRFPLAEQIGRVKEQGTHPVVFK